MDIDASDCVDYNRKAWDKQVAEGRNPWTLPVSQEDIALARRGELKLTVSAGKPTPKSWFPDLEGCRALCLASGGGQQGPLLAAAGAEVTVFDNSPNQLARDREVAEREGLIVKTVQGNMQDLSCFADASFDLIVNPVSCQYVPDVLPVWRESARVLKDGGILISGCCNPVFYLFEFQDLIRGVLTVSNAIPYSPFDENALKQTEISVARGDHLWFGHTLTDLIGGQLEAGFAITAMYEDNSIGEQKCVLDDYIPLFIVTRAIKVIPPSRSL